MEASTESGVAARVGVIGAGRMGGAYAGHLSDAGYDVIVVDPSPAARDAALRRGCRAADDVARLWAERPVVVFLSLAHASVFESVIADVREAAGHPGSTPVTIIETSTLPLRVKEFAARQLDGVGVVLLDCPVSGTGLQAASKDLVVYASGEAGPLASCRPFLDAFSRTVYNLGAFGVGTKVKLLANLLVGIHNAAAAEMLSLAERAGLDPLEVLPVIAAGAGHSRMLEVRGPAMARGEYGYGASVDLFRKDLGIIEEFARASGAVTPLLDVVSELYEAAAELGLGDEESAAVHGVYTSGAVHRLARGDT